MVPGPRYDLLVGTTLLVLTGALVAAFGVGSFLGSAWGASSVALFLLASAFSFAASRQPEASANGYRVDYLTLRGLSTVAIAGVMLLQGVVSYLDGELWLLLLAAVSAPFLVAIGVGTMLRKEWIVRDARHA